MQIFSMNKCLYFLTLTGNRAMLRFHTSLSHNCLKKLENI